MAPFHGMLKGPARFLCHRSIADDVLAHDMLDVLHVAPTLGIAVLQPNKRSSDVGRTMLDVVHDNGLFAPGRHEDLDRVVTVAVGALVERSLNAADGVLDLLSITPTLGIAVLQPNKRSSDIRWTVLNVVHDDWLFAPGRHEILTASLL